jgi:hypothetical protein
MCAAWVWTIQLNDTAGVGQHDGVFQKCQTNLECSGPCRDTCGDVANWEQRSNWVPQVPFFATNLSGELGALATTENLSKWMVDPSTLQRHDYTFFYNPVPFITSAGAVTNNDFHVWVRKSW